ncbi:MAG: BON domain-containing protein [Opitutaceae bacterium]|nr:BON domain-containing protein [Opitutaceae bacterium]
MQLLSFLLGLALGALGLHVYYTMHPENSPGADMSLVDRGRHATEKQLEAWNLTPEEVRSDLESHGKLVRRKAEGAGQALSQAFSNTRILSVIKAKYTLDKELSARAIEVTVENGHVILTGTVPSAQLISKAVAFAMDTEGVSQVESHLSVRAE